jgi:hypothetical protein
MNEPRRGWSKPLWFWSVLFLFLTHAAAVFWLAERREEQVPGVRPNPFFHIADARAVERLSGRIVLRDPTLFALPHPRGFSAGASLGFKPALPSLTNWNAVPEWLPLNPENLGGGLAGYVATNRPSGEQLLASLRLPPRVEVRIPDEPVTTATTVRVEGPLAAHRVLAQPPLPSLANNDVVRTIVEVLVNREGLVESAIVIREAGLKAADESALALAREFVFDLAPESTETAGAPVVGRLHFLWHVVPMTNAPSPTTAAAALP